jgi:lysophospholipase L1-like esterase
MLAATTRTNIWMVLGDLGVSQATTPGRVSSLTSQGGANNWTTLGATQEPSYTASDSTLGGKGTWALNGSNRYMLNAYNPPAPLTQPHYRISVVKVNQWFPSRATVIMSAAIGFGMISDGVIRHATSQRNTAIGPNFDFPPLQWCIVEEYFSGSTSDFTCVGPLDNTATGVNVGNTDPAAPAMGASATGTLPSDSSYAFSAAFLGLPTAPERAALRQTLLDYYGSQLLRTRKLCRYYFVGDSITFGANATGNDGFRRSIYDNFFTALGYPTFSVGANVTGTYNAEFARHGGVPGQTIAGCSTYLLDPTTGQIRTGGQLINSVQLLLLMIGTNDMTSYVPVTTATAYRSLLDGIQAQLPNARMVVTTIVPQGPAGNNPNVQLFNAELPAHWDAFDAANPTRALIRWDANTAIGGPSYVAGNFGDTLHPNDTGHALLGAAVASAVAPILNTLTTY